MDSSNLVLLGRDPQLCNDLAQCLLARQFKIIETGDDLSVMLDYQSPARVRLCVLAVHAGELALQLEQLFAVRRQLPNIKLVIISQDLPHAIYRDLVRSGVRGIFRQDISGDILGHSLRLVLLGLRLLSARSMTSEDASSEEVALNALSSGMASNGVCYPGWPRGQDPVEEPLVGFTGARAAAETGVAALPPVLLSSRERQVLLCLANGLSNKAIARDLSLAEATVKAYVKTLLRKIRVANRTQAAIWTMTNISWLRQQPGDRDDGADSQAIASLEGSRAAHAIDVLVDPPDSASIARPASLGDEAEPLFGGKDSNVMRLTAARGSANGSAPGGSQCRRKGFA